MTLECGLTQASSFGTEKGGTGNAAPEWARTQAGRTERGARVLRTRLNDALIEYYAGLNS